MTHTVQAGSVATGLACTYLKGGSMLELKTKKELATDAYTLAESFELVHYKGVTYRPLDYETLEFDPIPTEDRRMWQALTRPQIQRWAAEQFNTLFGSDGELNSFDFMVAQNARAEERPVDSLLVRTESGLRMLDHQGALVDPPGHFIPNTVRPMLNPDISQMREVFDVIVEWLGDDEDEAHSLLHHLATALAPGYSAVKYVLLLGEGRNGKSVLLEMLQELLGRENVSNVTRQQIAEQSPVVTELNGKLLNLVFDGQAEYLKDSGREKSLIAGEPVPIRKLYESSPTMVQTNALFIEGLNKEPKSSDKSSALQKRLVRYHFPNVYALDNRFKKRMLSEEMLGAFLALLLEHFVTADEVATKLKPTTKAVELQLDHMYANSLGLQFLKYVEETDAFGVEVLIDKPMSELVQMFQAWRVKENDISTWAEPDVMHQFTTLLTTERKTKRIQGKPRKVRIITGMKDEARAFIDTLKGTTEDDDELLAAVVAEG